MLKLTVLLAMFTFYFSHTNAATIVLHDNWKIQDSAFVQTSPELISKSEFNTSGWISTQVPNTVMGALVLQPGLGFDPFVGTNLKLLPGSGSYYDWDHNFGSQIIPVESPFGRPWFYRTEF